MSVRNPVVIKKPVNIARPSKLPMKDILIRRSFDFSRRIKSRKIVVLRLAIFAALITQRGFGSNICSQNFGLFWRMKRRIVDLQQKSKKSYLKNNHKAHPLTRHIFNSRNFSLAVDIDMQAENAVYLVCSDIDRPKDQRRRFLERCLSLRLYFSTGVS